MPPTSSPRSTCCAPATACSTARSRTAAATRASATTIRSSSRSIYQSPNDVAPNRLADGSLVGARRARPASSLDPVNVNANGLTLRGVEFDYKTPRYHNYNVTLQTELAPTSLGRGRLRRHARAQPRDVHRHEQRARSCCRRAPTRSRTCTWPDFARGSLLVRTVGVSSYDSLQTKFQRRYHKGLQFLLSYTLSEAKTNAGDSLSGGGVGGLRAPDVVGWDLEERHRPLRLPHQARAGLQRQLRPAGQGRDPRRLARQLGGVDLQRPGADHQLRAGDRSGHRLLRAGGRRSVRGQPRRRTSSTTRRRSRTRLRWRRSGRPTSARSAARAARSPDRRCGSSTWASREQFSIWRPAAVRVPRRGVQPHQHAVVQPARVAGLRRRAELRQHHEHAQHAAADSSSALKFYW